MTTQWQTSLVDHLASLEIPETQQAAEFIRNRRVKINFQQRNHSIGAFWDLLGNISLNTRYFDVTTPLNNPRMICLVVHEVVHLRQGLITALSVYGELEAWQVDFRLYYQLTGSAPHPLLAELLSLPLKRDRAILSRARALMRQYAGKGYRVDLLPLFPLFDEIRWHLSGKKIL